MKYSNYETFDNSDYEVNGLDDYNREIDKISLLSQEEEITLAKKIQEGDQEAKIRFIEANLKLVRFIASKYKNKGVDFDDLIQEGNLVLIHAIEKFDPDKGSRFASYGGECIKARLQNVIANNFLIRKNQYLSSVIIKYNRTEEKLTKERNHIPSKYEMAEALGISVEEVEKIKMMCKAPLSMSTGAYADDEDLTLGDIISDPNTNVEDEVLLKLSNEELIKLIKESNFSEQEKVTLYYLSGLDGHEPRSQAEVAKIMKITRTRVNQLVMGIAKKIHINGEKITTKKIPSQEINEISKYEFDFKTKKVLRIVQKTLSNEAYHELESAIIKARQNEKLNSLRSLELVILLLSLGFVGNKRYAPIEIANILCSDYKAIAPIINSIVAKYENIINVDDAKSKLH